MCCKKEGKYFRIKTTNGQSYKILPNQFTVKHCIIFPTKLVVLDIHNFINNRSGVRIFKFI